MFYESGLMIKWVKKRTFLQITVVIIIITCFPDISPFSVCVKILFPVSSYVNKYISGWRLEDISAIAK